MLFEIHGRLVKFEVKHKVLLDYICKEFSVYEALNEKKYQHDILINIKENENQREGTASSPSTHTTFATGFTADFGYYSISYNQQNNNLQINVVARCLKESYRKKFLSIDYKSSIESIGRFINELVIVPINFFHADKAIIHAATVKHLEKNKTIMIGGTGGVGKTSLSLRLCRSRNYSFISDDIAVISADNKVLPHLAYPKIYAYNIDGDKSLYNTLFNQSTPLDKLQWQILSKLKGPKRVRRAIAPNELYDNVETSASRINSYYILSKTDTVNDITIQRISADFAADLSIKVIQNEYHAIFQHILWHEYNAKILGINPVLTLDALLKRWLTIYKKNFAKTDCFLVKVPTRSSHNSFIAHMLDTINET